MTFHTSRAALLAAARLVPLGLQYKNSPTIEELLEQHAESVKKALEGFDGKQAELQSEITEISQKMARAGRGGGNLFARDDHETWGSQFAHAKSADLSGMQRNSRVSMSFKAALTSATSDAPGSVGDLAIPERMQILGLPARRLTIRNLLNVKPVSSGSVERPRQVSRPTGAAPVAEGAKKPESSMQFSLETVPTRVIAHWIKASRQILDDVPQMESLVDVELRYGLALEEEDQLLNGSGSGQDLVGMMGQAAAFDEALFASLDIVSANAIDRIGAAILQGSLTDIPPDGIVMHPSDWWRIRLSKDADGKYIMGDPGQVVQPSMFGLPVVATQSQAAGNFLVGAFKSQTLYDRWEARVEAGFENDDFTRNMVTLLGEERVGFKPERPEALIKGEFAPA